MAEKIKIKLGATPKTFKAFDVTVQMPDGTEGVIPATFVYRTKKEFGRWLDEATAMTKKDAEAAKGAAAEDEKQPPEEFSWEKFYEQNTDVAVGQLLKALDSWGLDIPLSRESLLQLGNEIPAGVTALLAAYGAACREGRLGN